MPEKKQSAWRFLWRSEDIRRKLLITLAILMIFRTCCASLAEMTRDMTMPC